MRWKQVYNEKTEKYEMIPIDEAAARRDGHFVRGDIEPFVSPIDGAVIGSRRQMAAHCDRHGVRPADEYPQSHYDQKAKERADHYEGRTSREETQARRENIHEIINHLEVKQG